MLNCKKNTSNSKTWRVIIYFKFGIQTSHGYPHDIPHVEWFYPGDPILQGTASSTWSRSSTPVPSASDARRVVVEYKRGMIGLPSGKLT